MKYNSFYFWMFRNPMKKVLVEKYDKNYAAEIMKKSKSVYRELVEKADNIGDDDATFLVPCQVVFCNDRPEHGQRQSREQKERCEVCQVVHAGKRETVPDLIQGGLCRSAV